jgi:hypothetical protein
MAEESGHGNPDEELREEIARSRDIVSRSLGELRYELDFPRRIRRSFQRQSFTWITAAVVIGALWAIRPARRKEASALPQHSRKQGSRFLEAGFLLGVLKIAANILKPVAVNFLKKKVSEYGSTSPRKHSGFRKR